MQALTKAQIHQVTRTQWLESASRFKDYNYRQTWDYGIAMARRHGGQSEHVAISVDGETIALADVRIKRLPIIGGGIAYVSGGPLSRCDTSTDLDTLELALRSLVAEYSGRRGYVLRILPPLGPKTWNATASDIFAAAGFQPTQHAAGYRTIVVDINRPVNAIRSGLAQKWRNCLNAAERNGMHIRVGDDDSLFEAFCGLFEDFRRRKGFGVELDAEFYSQLQQTLAPTDRFQVSLCEEAGKVVAGHVCSMLGDTCVYLLGATNEAGLKSKAAYLLQWNAMVMAKERGLAWYDLGGIDPQGNSGVFHFKSGLGGIAASSTGPFETSDDSIRSRIALDAERAYRWARAKRARDTAHAN